MSTHAVTASYRPITAHETCDPHAVLSLVLSLLSSESQEATRSQNAAVVSSSYIKALTRSSQEKLIQAKAEVDVARLDVEDRDREWQTLVAHRQAVQRETRKLNSAAMVEDRKDRLGLDVLNNLPSEEDFLRDASQELLDSLPSANDSEYEPALLEARLRYHLDQLSSREEDVKALGETLKALKKDNDALRKQHSIADHHLNELARGMDKVLQALEDAEKLST